MNKKRTKSENDGHFPLVSVILPIRNEARFITRSLNAVLAQDYPADRMEIIVIDGMSDDGTLEILRSIQPPNPRVQVIENPLRIVPTALNIGLARAIGDIVIRVDGHCEIAPDYVRRSVEHLLNAGVDGVGGPLETIGETEVAKVIAIAMSSRFGVGDSAFRTVNYKTMLADTVAFPAYNRSIVERVGAFDEELVRNQDDDYNYRLRKIGAKILLASDVRSRYYSRGTISSLWRQYFQYGYWKVRVMQKHPYQMQPRQFVPPLFVIALLLSLLAALWPVINIRLFGLVAGSYALTNFTASFLTTRKKGRPLHWLLPVAFATLHLSYGFGFLYGLIKFWNRWGDHENRQLDSYGSQHRLQDEAIQIKNGIPRPVEAIIALAGLVVSAPVIALAAFAIAITSRGPAIFRQERMGRRQQTFVLYKLRTMRSTGTGLKVTASDDTRITGVGKILRKTKLDELPELWNILKGDMSLVGPRPEVPQYVDLENPLWSHILEVRPGLTDPMTLRLRNEEDLMTQVQGDRERFYMSTLQPFKLNGYLNYLQLRSWRSDMKVLWQTVVAVVFHQRNPLPTMEEIKTYTRAPH